jgi:hypothetical protein
MVLLPVETLVISGRPLGVGGLFALGTQVGLGHERVKVLARIKFEVDIFYSGKLQVLNNLT